METGTQFKKRVREEDIIQANESPTKEKKLLEGQEEIEQKLFVVVVEGGVEEKTDADQSNHENSSEGEDYVVTEGNSESYEAYENESGDESEDESDSAGSESEPTEEDTKTEEEKIEVILKWMNEQREKGHKPKKVLKLIGFNPYDLFKIFVSNDIENMPESEMWNIVHNMLTHTDNIMMSYRRVVKLNSYRKKLPGFDTFDDLVKEIEKAKNILVLTGAGISVSCGIPDFRSPTGLYAQIEEKYQLPDPQCLFDIEYLKIDPKPFFEFAKEIYPGTYTPSPTHYFIKELDKRGKLLRNYTQNIDTLETLAGISQEKLVTCHGSFATATCVTCGNQVSCDYIRNEIINHSIPYCTICEPNEDSFYKPDITFFGESLPDRFGQCLMTDVTNVDLLLVMGSSLSVQPVALVPNLVPHATPQFLINKELVGRPHEFDYAYLGACDSFSKEVCEKLGWSFPELYKTVNNNSSSNETVVQEEGGNNEKSVDDTTILESTEKENGEDPK
eukprot:TRINITY_DN7057_c0_g1_i1.p1 TRINITY_DN7057_c0_g1~~TRINITY_DN7057_c0_g1_i1.p1  ORF type:complete len:503 (-),score=118.65 TRINITY_DN7057_c0_g1_i1:81-1589(-)